MANSFRHKRYFQLIEYWDSPDKSEKKTFNFESAMIELEKIVKRLEGENESLEKSLELFEKGTKLAEQLRGKLDAAEQRIKVLQKDKEVEINREDIS